MTREEIWFYKRGRFFSTLLQGSQNTKYFKTCLLTPPDYPVPLILHKKLKHCKVIRYSLPYCIFPISRRIYSNICSVYSIYNAKCNNIEALQPHVN